MPSFSYFTQSGNFISATQGSVDPRTGLFSLSMPIANLIGNNNLGPSLTLALSYAPLTQDNPQGIGTGCTLGLSYYDYSNRQLYLDTGEQYKIIEMSDNTVMVDQKRLNNFNFVKISSNEYQILYKSGGIQVLTGFDGMDFLPTRIYTPSGRVLMLSWAVSGSQKRLLSVSDENDLLCQVSYDDNDGTASFNIWPGTTEMYNVIFTWSGNGDYLSTITNTAVFPELEWTLAYEDVDEFHLLTAITAPTGYRQVVTYDKDAIVFPLAATAYNPLLTTLPAVTQYVQTPGFGQPQITTTYDYQLYQGHNYLGAADSSITSWDPNKDALLNTNYYDGDSGYLYGSIETVVDANNNNQVILTTKRTYNSLHLMTQQVVEQGSCTYQTDTEYDLTVGVNVDGQPAQYQCPITQTVTYTDTSLPSHAQKRSEITTCSYDDEGNPLTQITPDGTQTDYSYYPASGDDNCPAEPNGFTRFVQTQTVIPPDTSGFDAPTQITNYTYSKAATPPGGPTDYVVLQNTVTNVSNKTTLSAQTTTYNTDASDTELGRITRIESTIYQDEIPSYTSTADFIYSVDGESLVQNTTYTGYDYLSFSVQRCQSRYSGRVSSTTDRQGSQTTYSYDNLGRLVKRVLNPNTEYENTYTTTYELSTDITTTRTDSSGNSQVLYFDGMGRILKKTRNDQSALSSSGQSNTEQYTYLTRTYDELGRLATSITQDVDTTSSPQTQNSSATPSLLATLSYNNWGKNYLTQYSDKRTEYANYDPVSLQIMAQLQTSSSPDSRPTSTLGKQVITLNVQQLPIQIEHIDAYGHSQGYIINDYDGLKRLRQHTDELGNITSYTYDDWGRVATQTLPDGSVVTKSYAPFSGKSLVTSISVTDGDGNQTDMGTQTFDSLQRLTQSTSGGRTYSYSYTGSTPVPDSIMTPAGDIITYQYIPQLGNALSNVSGYGLTQTRGYDNLTGLITSATDSGLGNMGRTMTYVPAGYLATEDFSPENGTIRSTGYTYSLMGNPLSYTDVTGVVQTCQYDAYGRPAQLNAPSVTVTLDYDDYGRLISQVAKDGNGETSVTTALTYDDFSREIKRVISSGTSEELLTIAQSYQQNGQLASRETSQGSTILRREEYTYDSRNRLIDYQCSGDQLPQDSYGKSIQRQQFTYDSLSNITQCITTFSDGSGLATDTALFYYTNQDDPTQLIEVTHSHPDYPANIVLSYDNNGCMTQDEAGRTLSYDILGRLNSVSGAGATGGQYGYDGLNTLVTQAVTDDDHRELYYRAGNLVNELKVDASQQSRFVKIGNRCVGVDEDSLS
ncbi:RHS repeat domain-containing protein [Photorhabdus namnaonensis]|uniref:tRNA nuclease WapA n=1 Tax=Photorhabdus namnaonensis TaxID=1851568 RepID=A0A1B8YN09_9GAMM|nr:RHS repeat domain-containing protein [Photorhabdus namnaonensis]OCA56491.1 tRNA nuclease WapA precursor [Photorhabdus namnaonensis]